MERKLRGRIFGWVALESLGEGVALEISRWVVVAAALEEIHFGTALLLLCVIIGWLLNFSGCYWFFVVVCCDVVNKFRLCRI